MHIHTQHFAETLEETTMRTDAIFKWVGNQYLQGNDDHENLFVFIWEDMLDKGPASSY